MKYPRKLEGLEAAINDYARYKKELGAEGIDATLDDIEELLIMKIAELKSLPESDSRMAEPSELAPIRMSAPKIKRRLHNNLNQETYDQKLKGALFGRFAGCALGAPVELMSIDQMEKFAVMTDMAFPPVDYWNEAPIGYMPRYKVGMGRDFTKSVMRCLPPDDDIAYTLLGMMILEEFGADFTTDDVGRTWQKYLPIDCTYTAERAVLVSMNKDISPMVAADDLNPYTEWIGAAIRCDAWAFVNPGNPMRASMWAFRDAYLSHRRSGIYSAMYFSAVIAAAFVSESLEEALRIGFDYIPENCEFTRQIKWAIEVSEHVTGYKIANKMVSERFEGMDWVHAINNGCLTVWGILIGKEGFTRGISETVAMAYDNDCTAATVGSVLGAFYGIEGVPAYWYEPWNNKAMSYLHGISEFDLEDVLERFKVLEERYRMKQGNNDGCKV